jgi:protein tyrosine phosphatase (PTP) superfamily phosphohydrolase (DUF442 family)
MPRPALITRSVALLAMAAGLLLPAVSGLRAEEPGPMGPLPINAPRPGDFPALKNVVRVSEKLYSGAQPEGEAGFEALRRLGIKTIITVDGAAPDVETAHRFGMRYVHIPFGYDACPAPTANIIVKAVRDLSGPIYLHCHHGQHRSPVAAAMARIALDGISNQQAIRELERAGTGKNYTGLYADVLAYHAPAAGELDALRVRFREVAPTPPLVKTMVEVDQRFDRLKELQKDGWKARPGMDAASEALQLRELFTEANRTFEVKGRPEDFRSWMHDSDTAGRELEAALRSGKSDEASLSFGKLAARCAGCHGKYRNVPQPR